MKTEGATPFKRIILSHLISVKGGLFLSLVCMVAFTLTELLGPWPLKIIFDHVLLEKPLRPSLAFLGGILPAGKTASLVVVSLSIVAIAILRGFFSYAQIYITSRISYRLAHTLRSELYVHVQRLSLSFHKAARSGELLTKITSDTNALRDVLAEPVLTFSAHLLTLTGMFAIMFALNWKLSLIVLATFPILLVTFFYFYREIKVSACRQRKQEGRIASRIGEILTALPMVQAFGRERYEEERFQAESAETSEEGLRTARMEAAATRTVEIISAAGTGAAIFFGAFQVLNGTMLPGELLIFAGYLTNMYRPTRNLAKLSTKFSKAMVSAERIARLLEIEPEIQDAPDAIQAPALKGEIVFESVSFDYGDGKGALKDVSFAISAGQRVALVGPSGAGKSTIVSLILRLYDPQAGSILIDGVCVKNYGRESLRRQIAIVLQDSVLFGATVKENIAYGKLDATMEEIVCAAQAANAHDFILQLPHGYDTILGERGGTLSGGQRRRIAIARAIIRNAPVLILDEPMTGLDAESEGKVRQALDRLMLGRTCLVITHDLLAAAEADTVLVLEEGRIVARGSHTHLLAQNLGYRRLCELKAGQPEAMKSMVGKRALEQQSSLLTLS